MNRLQEIVGPIVGELSIVDTEHFSIGERTHPASARQNRFFTLAEGQPDVVGHVAQVLYDRYYIQRDEGRGPYAPVFDRLLRGTYAEELASANAVPWSWQEGWAVEGSTEAGETEVVHPSGARRVVRDEELRVDGEVALIRVPSGSATMQQGFFHVSGPRDLGMSGAGTLRFYWNCSVAASAPIVRQLTTRLEPLDVPFHFKIVDDPQQFMRADNTVLYVPLDAVALVVPAVAATYGELGRYLRPRVPLFTRELAPGLGVAEDPGDGDSFGMHRSRLVAEGLWDAARTGRTTARGRLSAVMRRFARGGVDAHRPHLSTSRLAVDDMHDHDQEPFTGPVLRALG